MSEVTTFQDKDKKFTLTVKVEFLKNCPEPQTLSIKELNERYYMYNYLHNPSGPAIIRHRDNRIEFWLNARLMEKENPEIEARMRQAYTFNNKLNVVLNEHEEI